jgi:excisionase family DNA binding protein
MNTPTRARRRIAVEDGYLPLVELATYAGLSVQTLKKYLDDPRHPLPYYRVGGRILVRRSDFDAWALLYRIAPADDDVDAAADQILRALK